MADKLDCSLNAVSYSLKKLKEAGIVKILSVMREGSDRRVIITELALANEYKEGDSWREALKLKRSSSGGKAETGSSVTGNVHDENCLEVRMVLLKELANVYERLKTCQEENQVLHDENKKLRERKKELEEESGKRAEISRQLREDVETLEGRVRKLRAQTLQLPTEKKVKFDGSGAVILPGEGLPDKS